MHREIHKEGNSGRPIISSENCHKTQISQYAGRHLQPHVQVFESYVKDSTGFIKKKYSHQTEYHKKTF